MSNLTLMSQHARERDGLPENWHTYRWEALPHRQHPNPPLYYQLTGIACPLKSKGKNKGQPNYSAGDKATRKVVILTVAEHEAWFTQWLAKTGNCRACLGKGRILTGWGIETGSRYKPCDVCAETGKVREAKQ